MKLITNFKSISKTLFAALAVSTVMISCSKSDDNYVAPDLSGLNVIHASPTTEKLDFYVGNQKANTTNTGAVDFSFGNKFGYLDLYSGKREVSITKKGSTTQLLKDSIKVDVQFGYSLFIIDRLETVKFLLLKDDLTLPAAGKARVRFVNLSPDASALSLAVGSSAVNAFNNKAFKEYSTFENIDAANAVTLNVKNASGSIETKIENVNIVAGRIYTVFVKGLKANTDDLKLGVSVFTH